MNAILSRREPLADLLPAVLDGGFEEEPWSTFLDQLCACTDAGYAGFSFGALGRPNSGRKHLRAGGAWSDDTNQSYVDHVHLVDPLPYFSLDEGRAYDIHDFLRPGEPNHDAYYAFLLASGMPHAMLMRIREASGVNAWLAVAREARPFGPEVAELMEALAPCLRSAFRSFVALERERFNVFVADEAISRLDFAWFTLDAAGCVLACDPHAERLFADGGPLGRRADGRLTVRPKAMEQDILQTVQAFAGNRRARGRAVILSREPWTDMLLVPTQKPSILGAADPAVIAYVHRDSWPSADRCEQLAELFTLSPSEARLALALSRGMSIADAARYIGVTLESARTYTKKIYAKLGVRGQSDLVRLIMQSILVIA